MEAKAAASEHGVQLHPPGGANPLVPSASQRMAIEADFGPVLVLAGPGAGKTYCLAERIRHLIEVRGAHPGRICAFTFTNKAAGEIASRLATHLGERASHVKGGTIHAFCAELLRAHGTRVGLRAGFGIADEDYQRAALRRIGAPSKWQGSLLVRFAGARFRGEVLQNRDEELFEKYERFLAKRNMVDYDTLVVKAAELMTEFPDVAALVRAKWDHVLVDEFQDLNRKQYAVIRALGWGHRSIFAVGDDEQSIYSWAGADPKVFQDFANDFGITGDDRRISLRENRRCPREYFALARRLVDFNPTLFTSRLHATPEKSTPFPIGVLAFDTEKEEMAWIVDDIRRDRGEHGLRWGDVALLYRTNRIGDQAESAFLNAGVPVRLARGRALSEDPVVAYVIAALRVIANPRDILHKENFLGAVLPRTLIDSARAVAEENGERVIDRLDRMGKALPHEDSDGRKIRRGFSALRNLAALGSRYSAIMPLVNELLSQRVGEYRSLLDDLHHDLSDPARNAEVVALAASLRRAIVEKRRVRIARLGGVEIAMKAVLHAAGVREIDLGGPAPDDSVVRIDGDETPSLGAILGVFKAAQLIVSEGFTNAFADFTAVDIETTGRDTTASQIVEIAAVRVRDGRVVEEYSTLVKPRIPIEPGATATHGISEAEVAGAPYFEEIWEQLRSFCGRDVLVAHNGNQFDFPIIRRMCAELSLEGAADLTTYDTLPLARELREGSAKLEDLAKGLGIDPGQSHRALDDTRTLAAVFRGMNELKLEKARKTALAGSLDFLGLGLALSNPKLLVEEAKLLADRLSSYPLGAHSEALEFYHRERERGDDHNLPLRGEVVDLLGGEERLLRIQTDRGATERYPVAMSRMRGLLEHCGTGTLPEQINAFLEKASLSSRPTETEPAKERVNLLTLHATKGLEFSRVYIIGVEDTQFIGGNPNRPPARSEIEESRRLLYVGMTRAEDRLVMTRVVRREGEPTGGHQFLDEMGLKPTPI
ncbi:MAG TPA: UvrD-helicase domain-containing protein [Gemmatimonadaceae bacterium]|nr:UvrD-helicase domain-containing protein [Gemmatimonadaceae bacterium]